MISKVTIVDGENSPLAYLPEVERLSGGTSIEFKPGVNVVVGKNGCGKTTLLRLLSTYTLCDISLYSNIHDLSGFGDALKMRHMFDKDDKMKDGVKVSCDYAGVVYNYSSVIVKEPSTAFELACVVDSAVLSTGEKAVYCASRMFDFAFKNNDVQFPIKKIKEKVDSSNDIWKKRFSSMLNYYKENHVRINAKDFEYTFLMDEPDRNLDIYGIESLYAILSHKKDMAQLICVVHNPLLIYKLSKLGHINFVELTDGYVNSVIDSVER